MTNHIPVPTSFQSTALHTVLDDHVPDVALIPPPFLRRQTANFVPTAPSMGRSTFADTMNSVVVPFHTHLPHNAFALSIATNRESIPQISNHQTPSPFTAQFNFENSLEPAGLVITNESVDIASLYPHYLGLSNGFQLLDVATSMRALLEHMQPLLRPLLRSIRILTDDVPLDGMVTQSQYLPHSFQMLRAQETDYRIVHFILDRLINDPYAMDIIDQPEKLVDKLFKAGLEYILSHGAQYLKTLLEKAPQHLKHTIEHALFCAAVQLDAAEALSALLSRNLSPNSLYRLDSWNISYPLAWACSNRRFEVAKLLLHHGADPKICDPLGCLFSPVGRNLRPQPTVPSDLIRKLVALGAKVHAAEASYTFGNCELDVVSLLAENAVDNFFDVFIKGAALAEIILRTDWEHELLPLLDLVIRQRPTHPQSRFAHSWTYQLRQCLQCAAFRGKRDVIDYLLAAGVEVDNDCIFHAAYSKKTEVFSLFLDLGLDPNAQSSFDSVMYDRMYDRSQCHNHGSFQEIRKATAFSICIQQEFDVAIKTLSDRGYISHTADNQGSMAQALFAACEVGNVALLQQLLDEADSWCLERDGPTAMARAIQASQDAAIHKLLCAGVRPDGATLLAAIRHGSPDLCSSLRTRLMPAIRDSPLFDEIIISAVLRGYYELVTEILEKEGSATEVVQLNQDDYALVRSSNTLQRLDSMIQIFFTPLSSAIWSGNEEIISLLIAQGAHTPVRNFRRKCPSPQHSAFMTPLAVCCYKNDVQRARELLDLGADPFDDFAIYCATISGHEQLLDMLLSVCRSHKYDRPKRLGVKSLVWSIRENETRSLRLLIDFVDPGQLLKAGDGFGTGLYSIERRSPFIEAVRAHCEKSNDSQALHLLLPYIKNIDSIACGRSERGDTPLNYAISKQSLITIRALVESGNANVSLPCRWSCKRTPLQEAAEGGSMEIVEYLLEQGAQPNEAPATHAGATALQLAAIKGYMGIAARLIEAGADVNAKPAMFDGRFAFEGATEHGRIDMMLFLFKNGADLLGDDQLQYRGAVQLAQENAHHAALKLAQDLLGIAKRRDDEDNRNSIEGLLDFDMGNMSDFFFDG